MFGESDSESPRVPSPWDPYISTTSLASVEKLSYSGVDGSLPTLVAELEEGNVEYKLHLLHPSPARFARLVTQLKWRLLEGGGQAFYELGVADSGALVGLTHTDLEGTLDTLRAMAADIGARVVVVKEIEIVGVGVRAEDAREFSKKKREKDRSRDKYRNGKKMKMKLGTESLDVLSMITEGSASVSSTASTVTSLVASSFGSTASLLTDSDSESGGPGMTADCSPSSSPSPQPIALSTPIDTNAIPAIKVDLDETLALFSMEPEPDLEAPDTAIPAHVLADVYKESQPHNATMPDDTSSHTSSALEFDLDPAAALSGSRSPPVAIPQRGFPNRILTKAEKRRITRDLRRAERKRALGEEVDGLNAVDVPVEIVVESDAPAPPDEETALSEALESLHMVDQPDKGGCIPRIIVEAMITRQLDDEEVFLDFTRV
ncbi:hypothetical protein DENSPDRAFT_844179 [Dentipellis sp. KUC8613]|nr:hypothetical protein DENSPDRAFT_844179 [Dentipellis sp. KUC8613]